jgi:hypothetical protein
MKYIPILLLLLSSCAEFSMNKVIVTYNQQEVTVNNKNEEALNGCIIINDTENGGKAISSFFLVGGKSSVSVVRDSLIDNITGNPMVLHDSLRTVCFYTQPNADEVGKTACAE